MLFSLRCSPIPGREFPTCVEAWLLHACRVHLKLCGRDHPRIHTLIWSGKMVVSPGSLTRLVR
jgi:hypothetical protein